jgi:hypothetical protein
MKTADEQIVIAEIHKIQDELEVLGVRRERKNFKEMTSEQLNDFLETVAAQLQARRRWKGVS